jgi:hypothetical protein
MIFFRELFYQMTIKIMLFDTLKSIETYKFD